MAWERIEPSDYADKGVRVQNNPMALPAPEAQRIFDELSIPAFNGLIDALGLFQIAGIRINEDGQIEVSMDAISWEATASSGHVILNPDGTAMPQRSRMQFTNSVVEDRNGVTVVNGVKGDKGDKGDPLTYEDLTPAQVQEITGPQGPIGKTIVPSVSPSGVMSFEIQDTAIAPQPVNVRGPQGVQGVQGLQGPVGPQGPQGIQGATGSQGPRGEQGLTGPTGATGPTGPQGIQGPQGMKGDTGEAGRATRASGYPRPSGRSWPTGKSGCARAPGTARHPRPER